MARALSSRPSRVPRTSRQSSPAPRIRRSPVLVIAGVVLVIAGALVSVGIYTNLSNTQEVIAIVAPVARGEQIQRSDLTTVQMGFDPLLTPVPASQLNQIVGQYAVADLVPGTFLSTDAVGDRVSPGDGKAEVGVALMAGEYPDDGLTPGDDVSLIAVPDQTDTVTQPMSYPGTLVTISSVQANTITVTVLVNAADAPTVAALAASNKLALVLTTRER